MDADGSLTAAGKTFGGPALRTAERLCAVYLPPAHGPGPQVSAQQRQRALTFADCMRAHGVPNFPDPTFSSGQRSGPPKGINPQAPAFQSAARKCGNRGIGYFSIPG
jgi:hypothetical protein